MTRGNFGFINSKSAYSESDKSWWIDLINTDCIWYDMIINPPDDIRTNKIIKNYLSAIQQHVRAHCEKRFIYFLGSRKKVRFSTKRKPKYNPFTKKIVFTLLIGKEERKFRVKYSFRKLTPNGEVKITPNVRVTEKFLYIEYENGNAFVISVHDFVKENYIDLGIHTEVHYVGYTRQPNRRPVDLIHRGLSKMLYSVSNDDKDSKRSDLNKMFLDLVKNKMIKKISVNFQYEMKNEYFCFYSKAVPPQTNHFFVLDFANDKVNLDRSQDMMTQMALSMGGNDY